METTLSMAPKKKPVLMTGDQSQTASTPAPATAPVGGVTPAPAPPMVSTNAPITGPMTAPLSTNAPITGPMTAQPATSQDVQDVFRESIVEQLSMPQPVLQGGDQSTSDPFQGNGVQLPGGQWVPKDHPLAQGQTIAAPVTAPVAGGPMPTEPVAASPTAGPLSPVPPVNPSDPFGGNGVQLPGGQWVPKDHPAAGGAVPGAAGPGGDVDASVRERVLALLEGKTGNVENDPRAAAFRVAQRRNQDRTRAQAAESAGQSGLAGTGGFDGAMRNLDQARGESEASFEADIANQQMTDRRDELMGLLGIDTNRRGQDIQKYGINTSADLDRLQQQLSRYGLDLNDKQTAQRLGFDYAQLQELANRQAVLAALGQ